MKKLFKILAVALVATAFVALLGVGLRSWKHSQLPRKEYHSEGVTIYVEKFDCHLKDGRIPGTIYKPQDSSGRKPLVVYLGPNERSGALICRMAAARGFIAYAPDPAGPCSGRPLDATLSSELKDLGNLLERLGKEKFAEKGSIILMGHGHGALLAAMAAHNVKGLKGLVLLAPTFNLPEAAMQAYPKNRDIPDSCSLPGVEAAGRKFVQEARKTDPFDRLRQIKEDVLIICGSSDATAPVEYAAMAASKLKNVEFKVIDGAGHNLGTSSNNEMMTLVGTFLDRHR